MGGRRKSTDGPAAYLHPKNRPVIYSILVSLLLFFVFQFMLMYRESMTLDDQKSTLEAEIYTTEKRLNDLKQAVFSKERDAHRLDRRLGEMEQKFKQYSSRYAAGLRTGGEEAKRLTTKIFLITPTYARSTQKADLTRLSHTLMHVSNLYWIVVEDAEQTSSVVAGVLERARIPKAHLAVPTPAEYKLKATDPNWLKPRGVLQRNAGLKWLRTNIHPSIDGVVYFADDDNTYDLQLFNEMRDTKLVSVWPVGLVGGLMVERPLVNEKGSVYEFMSGWKRSRPFPFDMAGFAVHASLFYKYPDAQFSYDVDRGYQESYLLQNLTITRGDLEPKAVNCTKVYVWHTRTEKPKLKVEQFWLTKGYRSDDGIEV